MVEEIKAHRSAVGDASTMTSAESKNKYTRAAALIAKRSKPTAVPVPDLTPSAPLSSDVHQAALQSLLVGTPAFMPAPPEATMRTGFVFKADGSFGPGHYLHFIKSRSWFVAPQLRAGVDGG